MADFEKIMRENVSIPVRDMEPTSGILTLPAGNIKRTGVIVAHGAGNDMETPLLAVFSEGLAAVGYPTLRFNFLYKERGRKTPDNYETLAETWNSAAAFFRERLSQRIDSWVAAGKSMGGRVASQMLADGLLAAGRLIFLGYPLHSAGNKEKLRDVHLYRVNVPMLLFAGTRDPLCDLKRLQPVLGRLTAPWNFHIIVRWRPLLPHSEVGGGLTNRDLRQHHTGNGSVAGRKTRITLTSRTSLCHERNSSPSA